MADAPQGGLSCPFGSIHLLAISRYDVWFCTSGSMNDTRRFPRSRCSLGMTNLVDFAGDPYGNLPRPKNMPPACFLNGLSIPTQNIKKERYTFLLVTRRES